MAIRRRLHVEFRTLFVDSYSDVLCFVCLAKVCIFQVRTDYLKSVANTIDTETAFQFGVLEMKRFFNSMPQAALDKKSNFEFIE